MSDPNAWLVAWHFVDHWLGFDYTGAYGQFIPYDLHSGFAGSVFVGGLIYLVLFWPRHTCHASWKCIRWGRHEAAGGLYKLCWKHHPDIGEKPRHELILAHHAEWKARTAGAPAPAPPP